MSAARVSYYDMTLAKIDERISNATLTRQGVADGLGISLQDLNNKLSGIALLTVREIAAIAAVLDCRMSDLVA